MVLQKNQLLLRFLKLKVVVNDNYIYSLVKNQPVVIDMPTNPSRIVVTDGFHITNPIYMAHSPLSTKIYQAVCVIEDDQLLVGFIITILIYFMGSTSGSVLLQLLSVGPIIYFLFLYYIKRKEFIQLRPAR